LPGLRAREIYNNPKNLFVTEFIGDRNILEVGVVEAHQDCAEVKLGEHVIEIRNIGHKLQAGERAVLAIHKDKMRISGDPVPNSLVGEALSIHYAGSQIRIELEVAQEQITVIRYQQGDCECQVGDTVWVSWDDDGAVLLPLEVGWEGRVLV
jgi:spermidine/putrescine transport system ATP-binding protein